MGTSGSLDRIGSSTAAVRQPTGCGTGGRHLQGQRVAAFCGIGNPTAFHRTLAALGAEVVAFESFPDHHAFPPADLVRLAKWVQSLGPLAAVLCTGKDLVKIPANEIGGVPLWALEIAMEVTSGLELLEAELSRVAGLTPS